MTDEIAYRIVTTRLRGMSRDAILIDAPPHRGEAEVWVPRSLIHGYDDMQIAGGVFIGEEITFRLADWKAEGIGFA